MFDPFDFWDRFERPDCCTWSPPQGSSRRYRVDRSPLTIDRHDRCPERYWTRIEGLEWRWVCPSPCDRTSTKSWPHPGDAYARGRAHSRRCFNSRTRTEPVYILPVCTARPRPSCSRPDGQRLFAWKPGFRWVDSGSRCDG